MKTNEQIEAEISAYIRSLAAKNLYGELYDLADRLMASAYAATDEGLRAKSAIDRANASWNRS